MRINAAGVSVIGYRLSVIGYRLSAIGDRQAIEKDEGCPRLFSYPEPLASNL